MSAIETTTARVPWTTSETTPSISEDWLSRHHRPPHLRAGAGGARPMSICSAGSVTTSVWSDLGKALGRRRKLRLARRRRRAVATYVALLVVLSAAPPR